MRAVILAFSATFVLASSAAAHDELQYSAAACVPASASEFDGNGAQGFKFDATRGGWFNRDVDENQYLICPAPYFRDFLNPAKVGARVYVYDGNIDVFTKVWLCGQPPDGAPVCVSKDNFPDVTGYSTIELTLTPQLLTQFIWLRVRVPDADDNGPFGPDGTSGVIGYWIYRKP